MVCINVCLRHCVLEYILYLDRYRYAGFTSNIMAAIDHIHCSANHGDLLNTFGTPVTSFQGWHTAPTVMRG